MTSVQKLIPIFFLSIVLYSCNQQNKTLLNSINKDTLKLKINFRPAFEERCEAILLKTDSMQSIEILIKNDFRVDKSEDTFWFKKIDLTNLEYAKLDSSLIKMCKQKNPAKRNIVLDGMAISSLLINNGDSNGIYFHAPSKQEDSIGYRFTKSLSSILQNTFQDSVVNQYFYDIETYIGESKPHKADSTRKIDQLRMKKYNWSIKN